MKLDTTLKQPIKIKKFNKAAHFHYFISQIYKSDSYKIEKRSKDKRY